MYGYNETVQVKELYENHLFSLSHSIYGVGYGIGCCECGEHHIHIYHCPFMSKSKIPSEIEGLPVHSIMTGRIMSLQMMMQEPQCVDRTARLRPYYAGVSVGSQKVSAGTLGIKCYDNDTGEPLVLSNSHVGANETSLQMKTVIPGEALLQPGVFDAGRYPQDVIAYLVRVVPYDLHGANYVDTEVGRPVNPDDFSDEILGIGRVTEIGEASVGDIVVKSARTTGINEGAVIDTNATMRVDYTNYSGVLFKDQIVVSPSVGAGGDSGAVFVRKKDNKAVGLLFAGSDSITLANPMILVASALNINLGTPMPPPSQEAQSSFWGIASALFVLPLTVGLIRSRDNNIRR